ncbi:cAMP-dependent protein kinase catalytic subunit PRKX [Mustela nigripes]|uniref:cAMP-dependent protein kinase catalytic subunit PRKX n=1 Tax=Mustela nigripes TaxID=77151 RepID=UPI0028152B0C|nr:cAMP-dependent protein kinase catalytic subunit PRKX [Mustela nigripes]
MGLAASAEAQGPSIVTERNPQSRLLAARLPPFRAGARRAVRASPGGARLGISAPGDASRGAAGAATSRIPDWGAAGAERRDLNGPPVGGPNPGGLRGGLESARPRPGRFRPAPDQRARSARAASPGRRAPSLGRAAAPAPAAAARAPGPAPRGRGLLPPAAAAAAAVSAAPRPAIVPAAPPVAPGRGPGGGGRAWVGAADAAAAAPPSEAATREARTSALPGPAPRRGLERAPMEAPGLAKAAKGASTDSEPQESRGETPDGAPALCPSPEAPSPEPPAYRLQDFDTLATVGTGTFGRVQLVKDKTAKHFFALKVMSIPDVIRLKQEQHVHNEKSVLKEVSHPFLVKLFWTCHDDRFLYMLMEFVPGGELFSYLRNRGRFSSSTGLFYSAEIVCAIEYLHSREIVYRDLKPENILLDREGHIKLTDFGFAKKLVDKTWTLCGTPEYLAPEVIQSKGHGRAVDWWALGILIFEMHSGFPPFFDDNPFGIYQKILAGKIDFPRHLDFSVKDLIRKLLVVDRTRRLGNMKNGADDVKRHRWFRTVDWEAVPQRKLKPPIVPKLCGEGDTSNFEAYPENDWNTAPPVSPKDLEVFKNF